MKKIILQFFFIINVAFAQIPTSSFTIAPTNTGKPHFVGERLSLGTNEVRNRLYVIDNTSTSSDNNPVFARFINLGSRSGVSMEFLTSLESNAPRFEIAQNSLDYGQGSSLSIYGNKSTLTARNGSGMILRAVNAQNGTFDGIIFQTGINNIDGSTTERMRLDGNGNLGIGTTSPQQRLHIVGNTISSRISINTSTIANKFYVEDNTSTDNVFGIYRNTNSAGYTTHEYVAGTSGGKLEIGFAASGYSLIGYENRGTIISRNSSGLILRSTPTGFGTYDGITFQTGNSGILEKMRITSSGFVGIGTQNPNYKLHLENGSLQVGNGNIRVQAGDIYVTESTNGIILKSPNGTCWRVTIDNFGNFNRNIISCPIN